MKKTKTSVGQPLLPLMILLISALMRDISSSESEISSLLTQIQPALESVERTLVVAKTRNPDSKPFDVNDYRELVSESAASAIEFRRLVETVDGLLQNSSKLSTLVEAMVEAEHAMVDRIFLQLIALIFIFFSALLGYRFISTRILQR